jgi:hypothetical protein
MFYIGSFGRWFLTLLTNKVLPSSWQKKKTIFVNRLDIIEAKSGMMAEIVYQNS